MSTATPNQDLHTNDGHEGHDAGEHASHVHVLPLKVYYGVWAALMVLTVVTVLAAYVPFEALHVPLALGIASIKAAVVALFFMHLLYDEKYNLILLLSCFGTAILFFAFTVIDPLTRGQVDPISMKPIVAQMTTTTLTIPQRQALLENHGINTHGILGPSQTPIVPVPQSVSKEAETMQVPGTGTAPNEPTPTPGH